VNMLAKERESAYAHSPACSKVRKRFLWISGELAER
jgi:hypothetical protein